MSMQLNERNQKIDDILAQILNYEPEKFNWYYSQLENLDVIMDETGLIVSDYGSYMVTEPLNVDEEVRRIIDADFDLCRALLTLLFREDHFVNGSFDTRVERGDVKLIVERMRDLLREELQ